MDLETIKLTASEVFGERFDVCIEASPGTFHIGFKALPPLFDAPLLDVEALTDFEALTGLKTKVGVFVSLDERWKHFGRLMLVAVEEVESRG